FYPLVMGSGEYSIGSPLFKKATVHLENGRDLVAAGPGSAARPVRASRSRDKPMTVPIPVAAERLPALGVLIRIPTAQLEAPCAVSSPVSPST
ncbi:glycoside hydrolase domain-containing protein, partial [Streptomyces sp. NPDC006658]|uniref:glycoside hydrolase domain-containing protein n=1 Tax=Streptomyces sp. NPDC006658 TaxID=3156900 RepID=UPI0033E61220